MSGGGVSCHMIFEKDGSPSLHICEDSENGFCTAASDLFTILRADGSVESVAVLKPYKTVMSANLGTGKVLLHTGPLF